MKGKVCGVVPYLCGFQIKDFVEERKKEKMRELFSALGGIGFDPIFINYSLGFATRLSINSYALKLLEILKGNGWLDAKNGEMKFAITHSMGGLVFLRMLEYASDQKIGNLDNLYLITLETPFMGVYRQMLEKAGYPTNLDSVQDMVKGSNFLGSLHSHHPPSIKIWQVGGRWSYIPILRNSFSLPSLAVEQGGRQKNFWVSHGELYSSRMTVGCISKMMSEEIELFKNKKMRLEK